jgi:methylaspartate mutase epsilon subunit
MTISNRKIDEGDFLEERKAVLAMWPTGKDVDLDEAISYHEKMPAHKNIVNKLIEAKLNGTTLIHNLCGYTTLDQQIDLLLHLQNVGQSDFLHCIYDSFTRTCRFDLAERALLESERTGRNMLNGFPVVTYGVPGNRKVLEAVDRPISALGPSVDSRLATEIALASGYSEVIINTFIAFETYTKTVPLDEIIRYHQYVCRLAGYYQEKGVSLGVTVPCGAGGDNAPGLAPPSLGTAGSTLGALLAAAQGPKYLVFFNPSHGNLAQDVATSLVRLKLAREYLDRFGYDDVELFLENGNLGGQYPIDFDQAFAEVLYGPIVSALSGAQLCQIKTFDESSGIPTKENQARSLRGSRMMYRMIKTQRLDFVNSKEVRTEAEEEEIETRAILDKVLELGNGDPLAGAVKAYEYGVLDNPVANNPRVKAKVMGAKDAQGAVRYLNCGNLPFTKDMIEFHREKIAKRESLLGKEVDYDTIVSDMRALAAGTWLS